TGSRYVDGTVRWSASRPDGHGGHAARGYVLAPIADEVQDTRICRLAGADQLPRARRVGASIERGPGLLGGDGRFHRHFGSWIRALEGLFEGRGEVRSPCS